MLKLFKANLTCFCFSFFFSFFFLFFFVVVVVVVLHMNRLMINPLLPLGCRNKNGDWYTVRQANQNEEHCLIKCFNIFRRYNYIQNNLIS